MTASIKTEPGLALQGESILSLQLELWGDIWRNRHHIMSRLARKNTVLFASPPFYVRDVLQGILSRNRPPTGLSKVARGLYTYVPARWLPYSYSNRYRKMNDITRHVRIWQTKKAMNSLGMEKPILYIWYPLLVDMVGEFNESLVVYHCYDDYASFTDQTEAEARHILAQEKRLLERADIVFAASEELCARKRVVNSNTHLVRNAVDYQLFARAQEAETLVPADVRRIPGRIIGCVSAKTHYVDVDVLYNVFARRSDWSFVFIGNPESPGGGPWEAFKKLPNVYFLGRRELSELPGYLKGFEVCLMPYLMTEGVLVADSPLKMYEYLAGGKPVVSMPLPLISHLNNVITFARDANEWAAAIENALDEDSPEMIEQRQAVARENTWDQRVTLISELIAREMERRV